jgi:hypothetical protein
VSSSAVHPIPGTSCRSTEDVFRDHLALRAQREVERDIERNYAENVVLIFAYGVFRGRNGVRRCAQRLHDEIGDAEVTYTACHVEGEIAFLEWCASSERVQVRDGVDTFLIREGQIVIKTIHYTIEKAS